MNRRCKSIYVNNSAQVFTNNAYFEKVYPMDSKRNDVDALKLLCQEFFVPEKLTFDTSN